MPKLYERGDAQKPGYKLLWDTVKGSLPELKGKPPLLLTVVSFLALPVLPTIPLPGRNIPLWKGDN